MYSTAERTEISRPVVTENSAMLTDFPGHFGRRLQRLNWDNPAVHVCRAICICGSGNDKQEEGR